MKRRLGQLMALSLHEWRLLLASMLLLPLSGFKSTQKIMSRFLPVVRGKDVSEGHTFAGAGVIARMVSVAARHGIYRANCLKQSLVLWWLLGRRGIPSEIKIGVNKEGAGPLNAHAWVECDGQALNDSEDGRQRFSAFEPGQILFFSKHVSNF